MLPEIQSDYYRELQKRTNLTRPRRIRGRRDDMEIKSQLRDRWEERKWGIANIGIYMTDEERTEAFEKEAAVYCSQNNGDCKTCSLVNYGMDCHNNPI